MMGIKIDGEYNIFSNNRVVWKNACRYKATLKKKQVYI